MINSIIKEVAIYRNGAVVKRTGTLALKSGKWKTNISGLSSSLDASTVRLSLPEKVSGSNVQVMSLTDEQKESVTMELNAKIKKISGKISAKNKQIELWNLNGDFSAKNTLSLSDVSEYIEKLSDRLESLTDDVEKLNTEKKKLEKELKKVSSNADRFYVSVDLDVDEEGQYPFELSYYENDVSWYPFYEIHTEEQESFLSLRLRAKINQQTHEDFSKVKVTLYTGNPALSADIPELNPQYLSFYTPLQKSMSLGRAESFAAAAPMGMMLEETVFDSADSSAMREVHAPEATVSQTDTMMEYVLPAPMDISRNNEITSDLNSKRIACKYHIVAVPKLDSNGYLAAEVQTADINEVINSTAIVYHKGTYIGEIYIDADLSKPTYEVSLGQDEGIKLKREQKKRYQSNVLLKGQKKVEFEYELVVKSSKNKECQICLLDQIPVSNDKSIEVSLKESSGASLEAESGKLKWEFDLPANESKVLKLHYDVAWPKDKNLSL